MKINLLRVRTILRKFASDHRGQSMTEYALICALIAFGSTAGYKGVAEEVSVAYNHISGLFTSTGVFGSSGSGTGTGTGTGSGTGGDPHGGDPHGGGFGH